MPFNVFVFLLSIIYGLLGIILYLFNSKNIHEYFSNNKNNIYIYYAIIGIIFGTILADLFMWYAFQKTAKKIYQLL